MRKFKRSSKDLANATMSVKIDQVIRKSICGFICDEKAKVSELYDPK